MLDHQTFNDAGLLRRYIVIHFHNTIVNGTSSLKVFERYLRLTKRLSKMTGLYGCIIGKALYDGAVNLRELADELAQAKIS